MCPKPRACAPIGILLMAIALWWPTLTAQAADPRAESLFREALELMTAGKFTDACPKLRASHEIEPKSGALIMLANCHEQVGKTATAWAEYLEAVSLARTEGRPKNADKAAGLAKAIDAKLSRLRIAVTPGTPGLTVTLDGGKVPSGTFDTSVAIDPGPHLVSASAPGHIDWSAEVTLGPEADSQTVTVPLLVAKEPPPEPPPVTPSPKPTSEPAPGSPRAPDAAPAAGGVPTWALIVGGAGIGMAAVAVVFAVDQSAAASELDDRCGDERLTCPQDYDFESDRAREERDFGLFVGLGLAGAVGIGAALIGIVTASSEPEPPAALAVTPWLGSEVAGGSLRVAF